MNEVNEDGTLKVAEVITPEVVSDTEVVTPVEEVVTDAVVVDTATEEASPVPVDEVFTESAVAPVETTTEAVNLEA